MKVKSAMDRHVAIIGAGHAGGTLALQLRELGFAGRVTIFGEEPHPPYQRPPLSKKYLSGEWGVDRLLLRTDDVWPELKIEIRTSAIVSAIDPVAKTLTVDGETLGWSKLALTTGAVSRPLPPIFAGRTNVFELRTIADVEALRGAFLPGSRLAIVGGGFIGLETAAVAARHGLEVIVVERAKRILERAVGPATSDYFRKLHRTNGVRIIEEGGVVDVVGDGTIRMLVLHDGSTVPVDFVLVGIGVLPATRLALAAGLAVDDGIAVDERGRTSTPEVWAAGDCASFPLGDRRVRLESVQNAVDQAKAVAADMLGKGEAYRPCPWFWSDQYKTKLQIAGLSTGWDDVVTRPSRAGSSHWYFRQGRFVAVEAIDDSSAFMVARRLLEAGVTPEPGRLADAEFDPRSLL